MEIKGHIFVVCPIGEAGSDIREHSDRVLTEIIQPVAKDLGYDAVRVDGISESHRITKAIASQLSSADIVIANLTGTNANVMYEIGARHALGLPYIHLAVKDQRLPFDLGEINTIFYTLDSDPGFGLSATKDRLADFIKNISKPYDATSFEPFIDPDNSLRNIVHSYSGCWNLDIDWTMWRRHTIDYKNEYVSCKRSKIHLYIPTKGDGSGFAYGTLGIYVKGCRVHFNVADDIEKVIVRPDGTLTFTSYTHARQRRETEVIIPTGDDGKPMTGFDQEFYVHKSFDWEFHPTGESRRKLTGNYTARDERGDIVSQATGTMEKLAA